MLIDSVARATRRVSITSVTITHSNSSVVLATPTLAYAGFAAGWLAGDIVRSIIKGG